MPLDRVSGLRKPSHKPSHAWWYQFYFATERGRAGYDSTDTRSGTSSAYSITEVGLRRRHLRRSAAAFDNPDHVAVAIHNYRWRLGLAEGETQYDDLETQLAAGPVITVPTITRPFHGQPRRRNDHRGRRSPRHHAVPA